MKIVIESDRAELKEKSLSAVRKLSSALAAHDVRLYAVSRALWKSETGVKGSVDFQGMSIAIENPAGSTRHWKDASGQEGQTLMKVPYGFVRGTKGADGDAYDCFVGPNPDSPLVWIVHQARPDLPAGDVLQMYDEDKAMLGFDTIHDATAAYLQHYDDPRFFGSVTQMTVDEFRTKVLRTQAPGEDGMLKSAQPTRAPLPAPDALFVVPIKKAVVPATLSHVAETSRPPHAVEFGVDGVNIAAEVPPRPVPSTSPITMRAPLEAFVADRDEERKIAPRRDPKVYDIGTLTDLPVHPLPEWQNRIVTAEAAVIEGMNFREDLQRWTRRQNAVSREHSPLRLLPRETRSAEHLFIPETPIDRRKNAEALKSIMEGD